MQKPSWKIRAKGGTIHILSVQITKGHVIAGVDGELVLYEDFSGYKNEFLISVSGNSYSLQLINKPVGGYDYCLIDSNNNKLEAIDLDPSLALKEEANKAAKKSSLKRDLLEYVIPRPLNVESFVEDLVRDDIEERIQAEKEIRRQFQKEKLLIANPHGVVDSGRKTIKCAHCGYNMPETYGDKKYEFCFKCGARLKQSN